MARQSFGSLEIDPARNPAVLDTCSWDPEAVRKLTAALEAEKLEPAFSRSRTAERQSAGEGAASGSGGTAAGTDGTAVSGGKIRLFSGSRTVADGRSFMLGELPDGQHVLVSRQSDDVRPADPLGAPLSVLGAEDGGSFAFYPTDARTVDTFCRLFNPEKGPRALGPAPRLGIGVRHSTAVWPAVFSSMDRLGYSANAIQNSLRELNLLEDLKAGRPPHTNYLFSFGTIAEGHTGSTFEGLWLRGVLEALKAPVYVRYGADADHIQVKRGADGIERAKKVLDAARYYTFYTLDVSDVLRYDALNVPASEAHEHFELSVPSADSRAALLSWHGRPRNYMSGRIQLTEEEIVRFAAKYSAAFEAAAELSAHLSELKKGLPYDLELSIDETPADVSVWGAVTTPREFAFVVSEIVRRNLPFTHLAPNLGIEKATDYRCPDGLGGLEVRTHELARIAEDNGFTLDCHSGDDLSRASRKVIGRAAGGRLNFKVSPMLQIIFAETLADEDPERFRLWWDQVHSFVKGEAETGSAFAADCIRKLDASQAPSPADDLFHYYCFVPVGARTADGGFSLRDELYAAPAAVLDEYHRRIERFLGEIVEDLYGGKE